MSINDLDGHEFEELISELLKKMGFSVERKSLSGDNGVDIIAYSQQAIIGGKYIIQCKRWNQLVGEPVIRDLYGTILNEHATKGILITNSSFSDKAMAFADGKNIELIDGSKLSKLFKEYNLITGEGRSNVIVSFIDNPGFDKEQYLYLKSKMEENRKEKIYYEKLQKFYHSYVIDHQKVEINKSGLIDAYIQLNNEYTKRFCKGTKANLEEKNAVQYMNGFLYILKGELFKAVEIYDDLGILDFPVYQDVLPGISGPLNSKYIMAKNLYVLFSFIGYKMESDYIMYRLIQNSWFAYFKEKDRVAINIFLASPNEFHYPLVYEIKLQEKGWYELRRDIIITGDTPNFSPYQQFKYRGYFYEIKYDPRSFINISSLVNFYIGNPNNDEILSQMKKIDLILQPKMKELNMKWNVINEIKKREEEKQKEERLFKKLKEMEGHDAITFAQETGDGGWICVCGTKNIDKKKTTIWGRLIEDRCKSCGRSKKHVLENCTREAIIQINQNSHL